ncbi:tyrosine recombinase XerC [Youxingia wuxianensis]|uniref:Tyrosine recombinase XerC n=1 Tax=Youxingia wuxianensis TaxID=2763678 RepID=A0A926ELZ6_9FIRM|nr:tyrosine recombinase XerC [Youxingia wuxianensis]MBC8584348.1 tyrosine recombinase XerC [Youxingia wuxianensis]
MAAYSDCPQELSDFLFYMLTIKGRSRKTVDAYYVDLRTFLRYIKAVKIDHGNVNDPDYFHQISIQDVGLDTISTVTLSDVYRFLDYTLSERQNNAKTRSRKVSAIRSFFNYLTVKENKLTENPVKNLEVPSVKKSVPKYLTLEESLDLLTHIDSSSKFYERDFCITTLFLNCGMRLSELVGINTYDLRENTIKLLGKGNKERVIYINEACQKALDAYLAVRIQPKSAEHKYALFLSSRGTRITPRRVEQIITYCLKQAGLDGQGYSPHKLRHTAATLMYQHGEVDIRVLKEILGHTSLSTTEIYTHISDKQMENAANKSPLTKVSPAKKKK